MQPNRARFDIEKMLTAMRETVANVDTLAGKLCTAVSYCIHAIYN